MGKVVCVTNGKGGVGKTTSSLFLAVILSEKNKVLLVDTDPQGSLTEWVNLIDGEIPFDFTLANQKSLERLNLSYDFIIIDTPPGNSDLINSAINVSDLVIIPANPSGLDITKVSALVSKVSGVIPYVVLFTQANKNTLLYKLTVEQFKEGNISYFENVIPKRESIKRTFGNIPDKNDISDYLAVVDEIKESKLL